MSNLGLPFETVYRNAVQAMYKKDMIPLVLLHGIVNQKKILKFRHPQWNEMETSQVKAEKTSTLLQLVDPDERPVQVEIRIVDPPKKQNEINEALLAQIFDQL